MTTNNLSTLIEQIAAGLANGATEAAKREALEACHTAAALLGAVPGQPLLLPTAVPPVPYAAAAPSAPEPDILDLAIARLTAHLTDDERAQLAAEDDHVPRLTIPLVQVPR